MKWILSVLVLLIGSILCFYASQLYFTWIWGFNGVKFTIANVVLFPVSAILLFSQLGVSFGAFSIGGKSKMIAIILLMSSVSGLIYYHTNTQFQTTFSKIYAGQLTWAILWLLLMVFGLKKEEKQPQ